MDVRSQRRKPIARTQSAPHRRPAQVKREMKRQTSSEALPTSDQEQEAEPNQPLISPPNTVSINRNCELPVIATELRSSCSRVYAKRTSAFHRGGYSSYSKAFKQ